VSRIRQADGLTQSRPARKEKMVRVLTSFGKPQTVRLFTLKILIQHKGTGRYLTEDGLWMDEDEGAKDFPNASRAVDFCREHQLKDVQITLRFDTGLPDIALPVG